MGLRPGHCYSRMKRAYTRTAVTVPDRNYIGTNPNVRTRQWNMGNGLKEFNTVVELIVEDTIQIRDNALEATRVLVTKSLSDALKKEGFFLKIRVYPHQVLRENKQAQGAGADRVTTGMSHAFGKPTGRAARVKAGQVLMSLLVNEQSTEIGKECLLKSKSKLPCRVTTRVHKDVQSIGTKPKKIKMPKEEKKEETTEAETGEKKEEGKTETKTEKASDKKEEAKTEKKGKEEAKKK